MAPPIEKSQVMKSFKHNNTRNWSLLTVNIELSLKYSERGQVSCSHQFLLTLLQLLLRWQHWLHTLVLGSKSTGNCYSQTTHL